MHGDKINDEPSSQLPVTIVDAVADLQLLDKAKRYRRLSTLAIESSRGINPKRRCACSSTDMTCHSL